ncbi:MAG: hypothetical protein Q8P18_04940 [Pseudomonadota bacterium]|nr:hypothetical protein [Pseudomonadota bacterium]
MSTFWTSTRALLVTLPVALHGGCTVHVGVMPASGAWAVGDVSAAVAEPDAETWVREAVTTALASRHALDPAGPAIRVSITEAAWSPARRSGDVLLYDARLTLRMEAGGRVVTRTRAWTAVDPGDAAGARALREQTLRMLARAATEDGVTWLLAPAAKATDAGL